MSRAAALCLLVGTACSQKTAAPPPPQPAAQKPAPAKPATLPEVTAASFPAVLQKHRGQPLLVNVFASWCTPCKKELPDLAQLHEKYPRLYLLGIDVDASDKPAEELERFISTTVPKSIEVMRRPDGVTSLLPALKLPDDWNSSFPPGWEKTIPLTFVYDAQGAFATGSVGQLTPEALQAIGEIASSAPTPPH